MKQTLYTVIGTLLFFTHLEAQVKFQIQFDSNNDQYIVSLIPETTYESPYNITGTGQVTIKAPTGMFEPTELTSLQNGMVWDLNAISEAPIEEPEFDYFSFGLLAANTLKPNYQIDKVMPLFSFKNGDDCPGTVYLMDNANDPFLAPNSKNANVGNQLTIFGAGGDAYIGNVGAGKANCADLSIGGSNGVGNINISSTVEFYPNPAVDRVSLEFETTKEEKVVTIGIYDVVGNLVMKQEQSFVKGFNRLTLDVSALPAGSYWMEFRGADWKRKVRDFVKI